MAGASDTMRYRAQRSDSAIWGGIADGLAGPGAGIATAMDIEAQNARSEAEAAQSRANARDSYDYHQKVLLDSRGKQYSLERRIKSILNTLMHKADFIGHVEVVVSDDDMDIELYSVDGRKIHKDTLSKGEQQLYATSILKALVEESGIQFPVFIDSPLQKFDKSHATKIITEFYPSISKQVVLFPLLHKELTIDEFEIMKDFVNETFIISNDTTHSYFEEVPINNFMAF